MQITYRPTKNGHVRILPLTDFHPAPDNAVLYRPIDPADPDVQALADSIREHGIREPLVISADGWILSGHRRYVAAGLAGLTEAPCRIDSIRRDRDPDGFLCLLREYNRQRVKSFDEKVREEVLTADPEEAYVALLAERQLRAWIDVPTMQVSGEKRRSRITSAKAPFLAAIDKVLKRYKDYWPLSDRQIHYALLNDPPRIHASKRRRYRNNLKSYKALTDLLTRARLQGWIPWDAIEDPTRPVQLWRIHNDVNTFIRQQFNNLLKGYWRDLMHSQPNHIELVVEKNTVESIARRVAADYTIPLTSGRGYCSLPPRRAMAERFRKSGKTHLVLLMLTDFDPDGQEIATSFARSMRDDFGIYEPACIKVALTAEQVQRFKLPPKMKAKETSSNYDKFVEQHGDTVYELEALAPDDLQTVLREAIESVVDREALNHEIAAEKADAAHLDVLRRQVLNALKTGGINTDPPTP